MAVDGRGRGQRGHLLQQCRDLSRQAVPIGGAFRSAGRLDGQGMELIQDGSQRLIRSHDGVQRIDGLLSVLQLRGPHAQLAAEQSSHHGVCGIVGRRGIRLTGGEFGIQGLQLRGVGLPGLLGQESRKIRIDLHAEMSPFLGHGVSIPALLT